MGRLTTHVLDTAAGRPAAGMRIDVAMGEALPDPAFIARVTLRFGIADPNANYHVPLLCSAWGYSTYRGS